jgi:iduronate 2-sulfatase
MFYRFELNASIYALAAISALVTLLSVPVRGAERPNVLFIAIDDLRCDLGAFGVEYAKTPHLDAFSRTARVFTRHYVQVPTCGASRCALLRGRYPTMVSQINNGGILQTHPDWGTHSLPAVLRASGYKTLAIGKITHYPGGRTGKGWSEGPEELPGVWDRAWVPNTPWKTAEAMMHGYANGVRRQPGKSPAWEAHDGPDEAYPDAWIAAESIETLQNLAEEKGPWFLGVGFFKPHLPFAAPKLWHDMHANSIPALDPNAAKKPEWRSGWHKSGEFRTNYGHESGRDPENDSEYAQLMRQSYAACVSYTDAQIGRLLDELNRLKLDRTTIVVVWSDHGFLLGEHAIWGKHCLYEKSLRSPLMIRYPGLPHPGIPCHSIVETVDLFPTLTELCDLPSPVDLDGSSLLPQLSDPNKPTSKPAYGFWTGGQRTVRVDRWRLITGDATNDMESHVELFDYETDPEENTNHRDQHPDVVSDLLELLERVPQPSKSVAKRPG